VETALDTMAEAFRDDPFQDYLWDTPDKTPVGRHSKFIRFLVRQRLRRNISSSWMISRAVDHGIALITATYASNAEKGNTKDSILDKLVDYMFGVGQVFVSSTEQKKRAYEFVTKLEAKLKEVLGDRLADLNYLDTIATLPAAQGRGYGSALIESVNQWSDSQDRAMYLWSSNIKNMGFYSYHGFQVVGEILLGDKNPTWQKPPVRFQLMLREVSGTEK